MTCIGNIPTEVKARRIVQCPGDSPLNVSVVGQIEFDHSILCEFDGAGEATGVKVVAVISYGSEGLPVFTYYGLSDGAAYTLPEGYTLSVCAGAASTIEAEYVVMCAGFPQNQTFFRWFVIENGVPTGVIYDTYINGYPFFLEEGLTPTEGKCTGGGLTTYGYGVYYNANALEITGNEPTVGSVSLPTHLRSITVSVKSGNVSVTLGSNTIIITSGSSFTWDGGSGYVDGLEFTFTGDSPTANYILQR